jgi:hypothetical protein
VKWRTAVAGCSEASGLQAGGRFAGASLRESFAGFTPRGANRERPGRAGSAAPLTFAWDAPAPAPGFWRPLAHGMILPPGILASHLIRL